MFLWQAALYPLQRTSWGLPTYSENLLRGGQLSFLEGKFTNPWAEFQNRVPAMVLKGQPHIPVILNAALWQNDLCSFGKTCPSPGVQHSDVGLGHPERSLLCKVGLRPPVGGHQSGLYCAFQLIDDGHILCTAKFDCIGDIKFPCSEHSITGQMRVSELAF